MPTRVMIMGLGPIGAAVARQLAAPQELQDRGRRRRATRPRLGKDLGTVAGFGRRTSVRVVDDVDAAIRRARPQVAAAVHQLVAAQGAAADRGRAEAPGARSSRPRRSSPTPGTPTSRWRAGSTRRRRRRRWPSSAPAINPGFAMDALPIALTGICERVDSIRVDRVQDARIRRLPFQQKIGAGLTEAEFAQKVKARSVRHVGLTESVAMIADALGWKLDRVTDEIRPKLAATPVESRFLKVRGRAACAASSRTAIGYCAGKPAIVLHMEAYLGAPDTLRHGDDRGLAPPVREGRRRLPRRPRDGVDRRQHDPAGARGTARAAHDAQPGAALVRRRQVRAHEPHSRRPRRRRR